MKFLLVHICNECYPSNILYNYYNKVYESKAIDGFIKSEYFFEYPMWISLIAGIIRNNNSIPILCLYKGNEENLIDYINKEDVNYTLFSSMDISAPIIRKLENYILNFTSSKVAIGGEKTSINFINYYKSIEEFIYSIGFKHKYNLDTDIFDYKDFNCIPRISFTNGCANNCKFCTVDKGIYEIDHRIINEQITFAKFNLQNNLEKLIYIGDKTFGQHIDCLTNLEKVIKAIPDAKFIIQTTAKFASGVEFVNKLSQLNVFAVEIGVETFNDDLLKWLNKGTSCDEIERAVLTLNDKNIKIIPNIIVGLPNENTTHRQNTLYFVRTYSDLIYYLNIYNLAVYEDNQVKLKINKCEDGDRSELQINKSFYTDQRNKENEMFMENLIKLGLNILER